MKKMWFIILGLVFVLTTDVYALTWNYTPNVSGDPETGFLTLAVSDVGLCEWGPWDTPPCSPASAGIFGASANLGSGFTSHTVSLGAEFYSWDSYNENIGNTGYNDVFFMALTEGVPYWMLITDYPVWDDPQLIWPIGGITAWGGDEWGDGPPVDDFSTYGSEVFSVDPSSEYYLNLILDTSNGGGFFPSWGYIYNFQIQSTSVPEPATLILIGSGLAGIGLWGRRKGL